MHFTVEAQSIATRYLKVGSIAIDATCGNGFDTLFLAGQVGSTGVVYGVDIQERAIETSRKKLHEADLLPQCRLVVGSHSQLKSIVDPVHAGKVSVVMFNLGYLPLGDKSIVTRPETTMAALEQAVELVRPGGLVSILAYPGHAGGLEEANCIANWIGRCDLSFHSEKFQDSNNGNSPILWALTKEFLNPEFALPKFTA